MRVRRPTLDAATPHEGELHTPPQSLSHSHSLSESQSLRVRSIIMMHAQWRRLCEGVYVKNN